VKRLDVANDVEVVDATENTGKDEPSAPCTPSFAKVVEVPTFRLVLVLSKKRLLLF